MLIGCMGPVMHQRQVGFVEPPRDRLQASLATDRIKVADVLQFRLVDGSTARFNSTCEVAPDGTIELSGYGKVQVAGKTLEEARQAVRDALALGSAIDSAFELDRSEYYLVTVTADGVQELTRVPLLGPVPVKQAVHGIPRLSHKVLWIVRPAPDSQFRERILAVDWEAIARNEDDSTNYLLRSGDWLFVAEEPSSGFGRLFNALAALFAPRKYDMQELSDPDSAGKASSPPLSLDQIDDPQAERI